MIISRIITKIIKYIRYNKVYKRIMDIKVYKIIKLYKGRSRITIF